MPCPLVPDVGKTRDGQVLYLVKQLTVVSVTAPWRIRGVHVLDQHKILWSFRSYSWSYCNNEDINLHIIRSVTDPWRTLDGSTDKILKLDRHGFTNIRGKPKYVFFSLTLAVVTTERRKKTSRTRVKCLQERHFRRPLFSLENTLKIHEKGFWMSCTIADCRNEKFVTCLMSKLDLPHRATRSPYVAR